MILAAALAAFVMIANGPQDIPPQIISEAICFTEPANLDLGQSVVAMRGEHAVEVGVVVAHCPRGAVCRRIVKCPPVPES